MNKIITKSFLGLLVVIILGGLSCGKTVDGGVFRSVDGGVSWEQKVFAGRDQRNRPVTIGDLNVLTLVPFPWNSRWIYLGSKGQGIYVSANDGEEWTQLTLNSGNIRSISIDPHNPNILFAAQDSTIVRSVDGGYTWQLVYTDANRSSVNSVVVDTYDNRRIYAATAGGQIFKSIDGGDHWDLRFETNGSITKLAMVSFDTRIIYALTNKGGVWVTTNGGEFDESLRGLSEYTNSGWHDLFTKEYRDEFGDEGANVSSFVLDPQDNSTIYINTKRGLLKGVNQGEQWSDIINLFGLNDDNNKKIINLAIAPDDSHTIFYTLNSFIYKSPDQGHTWQVINHFPSKRLLSTILINPQTPTMLYLGTETPPDEGGLFKISKKK